MEITIIALGSVLEESLTIQILTVSIVSLLATAGVYGIVALIIRMDDAGYKLIKHSNDRGLLSKFGHLLVKLLPFIIKLLSVIGTIALLLVSGGIFVHNIEFLHHSFPWMPSTVKEFSIAAGAGVIAVIVVKAAKKVLR